jgi:isopentenyl diphosphate isomerase/L-lactate dehydrogenase-like FMN-dependent dehydrogenase
MGFDMEQGDVARWRQQRGQGIAPWASKPGMLAEVGASSWLMLTGAPSPDVNMALVYDDDPDVLSSVLKNIEQLGCPALVLLAGDGKTRAQDLTGAWEGVGEMPMMMADLTQAPHAPDPRVRRADQATKRPSGTCKPRHTA